MEENVQGEKVNDERQTMPTKEKSDGADKNVQESDDDNDDTPDFLKNRWKETLEKVKPVAEILKKSFPNLCIHYCYSLDFSIKTIDDLPYSRNRLPTALKFCKEDIKRLRKQKKQGLWKNFTNSIELIQLEETLNLLLNEVIKSAMDLKVDLVGKPLMDLEKIYQLMEMTESNSKEIENDNITVDKE